MGTKKSSKKSSKKTSKKTTKKVVEKTQPDLGLDDDDDDEEDMSELDDLMDDDDEEEVEEPKPVKKAKKGRGRPKKSKGVDTHDGADEASESVPGDYLVRLNINYLATVQDIENLLSDWALIYTDDGGEPTARSFDNKKLLGAYVNEVKSDEDSDIVIEHILFKGRKRKLSVQTKIKYDFS